MDEFIPVVYNLTGFSHFDGSSKLYFLNHACLSSSLGTVSCTHWLSVLNLHPTGGTIDEGGSQDERTTSHSRFPAPKFWIFSRAQGELLWDGEGNPMQIQPH